MNEGITIKKVYEAAQALEKEDIAFFGKTREDEMQKIKAELAALKNGQSPDNRTLTSRLNEIDALLSKGNLSDDEYEELCTLEDERKTNNSLLKIIDIEAKEIKFKELTIRKEQLLEDIKQSTELIKAVQEYMTKRSEIALSSLKMPNVSIKFFEIPKSTGELKSCFKFIYKGHEYFTLSLSERIKVGIEVAAMLRHITKLDYPIFINNSESIGTVDELLLPSQKFFMRFVKDAVLTIKRKNAPQVQKNAA